MALVRFVVPHLDSDSGVNTGLLSAAYTLMRRAGASKEQLATTQSLLSWFEEHLPIPARFNRSTSKGYYRRKTKGIAWFRDTAKEHISRMYQLKQIAESTGLQVSVITEDRVGYIVYEDDVQVIAEPFSDTRTGT